MDHETIVQQVLIEHQTLGHVTSALRITIAWKVAARDLSPKLSSVRFVAQSFQRHLERLIALEDAGGYMEVVCERQPHLSSRLEPLKRERDEFRETVRQIMRRLEQVSATDQSTFDAVCDALLVLLGKLDAHGKKGTALLQEALLRDEGGEG